MALIESVVAPVGGSACSSGGGKKECWEERKGRSEGRLPELDTDTTLLFTSSCLPSCLCFLRLFSRSLSASLSRSEPETVPVVVSRSVPLVVLTSSKSLPSDMSLIFTLFLLSDMDRSCLDSRFTSDWLRPLPAVPLVLLIDVTIGRAGASRGL